MDDYSGGMRLTCQLIEPIETAREKHAKYLGIDLPAEKTKPAKKLEDLAKILAAYSGGHCPVVIRYHEATARASLRLGEKWHVRPEDDLMEKIREWLDDNNCAEIVYE